MPAPNPVRPSQLEIKSTPPGLVVLSAGEIAGAIAVPTGAPTDPAMSDAPDSRLRALCLAVIVHWRFTSARIRGQPVRVRVTVPFAMR